MLTGADDIGYDVITLGTYFSMFFIYIRIFCASHWLAEIWQLRNIFQQMCPIFRFDLDLALKKAT